MILGLRASVLRVATLAAVVLAGAVFTASAQGTQVDFGGLAADPTLPVEVSADQLQINQTDGTAILTGNVLIVQGLMRLTAANVVVEYAESAAENRTKISNMIASGGVLVVNGTEAAESQDAVYSVDEGTILMTGNVMLTQGPSVISSQKMTVDLVSGKAMFDGRVKTILNTGN